MAAGKFRAWKNLVLCAVVQAQLKCHFLEVTFLDWLILEVGLLHQSPTVIPQ